MIHGNAGHDLARAAHEGESTLIVEPDKCADVVHLDRVAEGPLGSMAAGVEHHLGVLHVEGRVGEERVVAHVVVVEVTQVLSN